MTDPVPPPPAACADPDYDPDSDICPELLFTDPLRPIPRNVLRNVVEFVRTVPPEDELQPVIDILRQHYEKANLVDIIYWTDSTVSSAERVDVIQARLARDPGAPARVPMARDDMVAAVRAMRAMGRDNFEQSPLLQQVEAALPPGIDVRQFVFHFGYVITTEEMVDIAVARMLSPNPRPEPEYKVNPFAWDVPR